MNFGYFWVFWRFFFGYTGIPLPPPPPSPGRPKDNDESKIKLCNRGISIFSQSHTIHIQDIYKPRS